MQPFSTVGQSCTALVGPAPLASEQEFAFPIACPQVAFSCFRQAFNTALDFLWFPSSSRKQQNLI